MPHCAGSVHVGVNGCEEGWDGRLLGFLGFL